MKNILNATLPAAGFNLFKPNYISPPAVPILFDAIPLIGDWTLQASMESFHVSFPEQITVPQITIADIPSALDVATEPFAKPDVVALYGNDLDAAAGGIIPVGATSLGTDALANDTSGARIVAVNGNPFALNAWFHTAPDSKFRVFEGGTVQFRYSGAPPSEPKTTQISYTIEAPGAFGETLTSTFTVQLLDRPSEIFAADDTYILSDAELSASDGQWVRLGGATQAGDQLLENDFFVSEITQINGAALQEGVFFEGSNGGQFRVFSGGVIDFVNNGPNRVAEGERTSFTYTGDQGNTATVTLVAGTSPEPDNFGSLIAGVGTGDQSGVSVSDAGDVNGDGYADILIGAFRGINSDVIRTESYVIYGTEGGISPNFELSDLDGTNGFVINGFGTDAGTFIRNSELRGLSVASAGDTNGDGFDDFLLGAALVNSGEGETYLIYGGASGLPATLNVGDLDGTNGFKIDGVGPTDEIGRAVASAGDINGDGFDDILVTAPGAAAKGASYLIYGTNSAQSPVLDLAHLNGTNGFAMIHATDPTASAVASAGDVNGDGYADILIGATSAINANSIQSGEAYVLYGGTAAQPALVDLSTLDGTNGATIAGIRFGDATGNAVASAGDFNGDGFDDVLIGARRASGPDLNIDAGQTFVVYGDANGLAANVDLSTLDGSNGFALNGVNWYDDSGTSVASAGDVNGDGYDDILIGAPEAPRAGSNHGETYLVFGRPANAQANIDLGALDGTDGFVFKGISGTGDLSGRSVSGAGDVNGDGYDDILIGAPKAAANGFASGKTFLVYGSESVLNAFDLADGVQDGSISLSHISDAFLF